MELDKIYNIDCVKGMSEMPDGSVDMVLTSPPYDNLRRYDGSEWSFEKFCEVARQITRILKDGGVCVWVVGDATINHSETGTSFRQALYFKDSCGLNLYDTMIFAKANPIPQNQRRYEQCFEYMFVISKGTPKTFNGIKESCQQFGRPQEWGRSNNVGEHTAKHLRTSDVRTTKATKLHGNIFTYGVGGNDTGHPAVFPYKLAAEQVATWTDANDVVCDPFCGSGTTSVACIGLGRRFIGFEICTEYYQQADKRIKKASQQLRIQF